MYLDILYYMYIFQKQLKSKAECRTLKVLQKSFLKLIALNHLSFKTNKYEYFNSYALSLINLILLC